MLLQCLFSAVADDVIALSAAAVCVAAVSDVAIGTTPPLRIKLLGVL